MLKQILPKNIKLVKHHDVILSSGKTSLAVDLEIQTVEAMQELRNAVLSENVEVAMNRGLSYQWQLCIDKTYFCQSYERQLLRSGKLTNHQEEKFQEIKQAQRSSQHCSFVCCSWCRQDLHCRAACARDIPAEPFRTCPTHCTVHLVVFSLCRVAWKDEPKRRTWTLTGC